MKSQNSIVIYNKRMFNYEFTNSTIVDIDSIVVCVSGDCLNQQDHSLIQYYSIDLSFNLDNFFKGVWFPENSLVVFTSSNPNFESYQHP